MKTKFGIVGCGFLGNIVADAWKKGLLEDYELVGVTSRTFASAEKTAASVGCAACADVDALLALEPEYIVEAASVEAVRAMAVPVLRRGVNLVVLSIGAFADLAFYEEVKQAAREGGAKVHLASGAIGGLDCLRAARVGGLAEVTYIGRKPPAGWKGSPAEVELDLDQLSRPAIHFEGTARKVAIAYPKNANVAAAVALAGTGFDATRVRLKIGRASCRERVSSPV